jgi:hypothetical protein
VSYLYVVTVFGMHQGDTKETSHKGDIAYGFCGFEVVDCSLIVDDDGYGYGNGFGCDGYRRCMVWML